VRPLLWGAQGRQCHPAQSRSLSSLNTSDSFDREVVIWILLFFGGSDIQVLLARHGGFDLELAPPGQAERLLAPEVAAAARAVVRGCVLAMLEHTGPRRIRVGWEVQEADLQVTVRDDGDGALFPQALAEYRLRERLAALGGDFALDAVPGWGTAITARFPLALPPGHGPQALRTLSPRELDVLTELARGLRNQEIAARLHITEHTVKFHVANILAKLGARSRGEAAAAARQAHL